MSEQQQSPAPSPIASEQKSGEPKVQLQMVITMYDNGQVNVSGPLENAMLMHGLFGAAKDAYDEWRRSQIAAAQIPKIQLPSMKERIALTGK